MAVAGSGIALAALYFSRSYKKAIAGSVAAIGWIGLVLTAHGLHVYTLYGRLDWIAASRIKYILIAFAVCLGLISPLGYLRGRCKRIATLGVLAIFMVCFIGLPFVGPAVFRDEIRRLPTQLDERGLCLQSRPYTCGPAAAVTALNRLGLEASEARIAGAAGTAPWIGTGSWDLYRAIERLYDPRDLRCRYRRFQSLDQIPAAAVALAVMREGWFLDHCVTILKVTPSEVLLADPAAGLRIMPRPAFEAAWRNTAIILSRPRLTKNL